MLYLFILRDVNRRGHFPIPSNSYRQELDILSPNLMELTFVLTEIQKFIQTHSDYIHSLWARKCLLLFVRKDQQRVIIIINFYPKGSGYNNLGICKIFILRLKFGNKMSQRRVLVKNFQIFILKSKCDLHTINSAILIDLSIATHVSHPAHSMELSKHFHEIVAAIKNNLI